MSPPPSYLPILPPGFAQQAVEAISVSVLNFLVENALLMWAAMTRYNVLWCYPWFFAYCWWTGAGTCASYLFSWLVDELYVLDRLQYFVSKGVIH